MNPFPTLDSGLPPGVTDRDVDPGEPAMVRCAFCFGMFHEDELEDGLCAECLGEG